MSYTLGFISCFFCCCVVVSVPMALGDLILPCTEVRNVTIIPYDMLHSKFRHFNFEKYFHDSVIQLKYLVKSLLDKPCSIFWIFSPIQSRSIRLTMENYAEFLEREFQAITRTDENEVIKVLLNIPHNNNDIKQTLFFVTFALKKVSFDDKHVKVFELTRNLFVRKQVDLVVWSIGLSPYRFFQKWLPKQNTIYLIPFLHIYYITFNRHLHQILMDQLNNPHYDWQRRYKKYINIECQTSKKIRLYFWKKRAINAFHIYNLWNDLMTEFNANATVQVLESPFFYHKFELYSFDGSSVSIKGYEFLESLKAEENDKIIAIHLPIFSERIRYTDYRPLTVLGKNKIINIVRSRYIIGDDPIIQNGNIMIHEDDDLDPLFIKMVFERINSILCGLKAN
eukprot:TCONS_00016568-protein